MGKIQEGKPREKRPLRKTGWDISPVRSKLGQKALGLQRKKIVDISVIETLYSKSGVFL